MLSRVVFSSAKHDWKTPVQLYKDLNVEFNFDFDPCPPNYDFDGLSVEWGQRNFVNPPYKDILSWISKSYEEYLKGKTVILLLPSRTDTRWWHEYAMKATEIRFIRGRLRFQGAKWDAPFPSVIVIYRNDENLDEYLMRKQ